MMEDAMMGAPDETEQDRPELPENDEDDAKWLEELGAEPTAILNGSETEQEKQREESVESAEGESIPEWLVDDLAQDVPADEAVPEWLRDEFVAENPVDAGQTDLDQESDALDETAVYTRGINETEVEQPESKREDEEIVQELGSEADGNDDLSWLDQIAAGGGSAIDEPPTLAWEEQEQGDVVKDEQVGTDMTWLDDLATGADISSESDSVERDEEEPAFGELSTLSQDEVNELPAIESDMLISESPADVPEDPDEAMAWLEQLAAKQGAPMEELPTVSERVESQEVLDANEIPDDPDEAMAWLEQLASREEDQASIVLSEDLTEAPEQLPVATEEVEPSAELLVTGADQDEGVEIVTADLEENEVLEGFDEAIMWLEEMIEEPDATEEALSEEQSAYVSEEPPTPAAAFDVEEARAEAELILSEQPQSQPDEPSLETPVGEEELTEEDEEDALAWLEQLAGRQGADPEELTTIEPDESLTDDVSIEAPGWLEQELSEADEELQPEKEVILAAPMEESEVVDSIILAPESQLVLESEEPFSVPAEPEGLPEQEVIDDSQLEVQETLTPEQPAEEDLAWLETLGSVDADSWLEAEAEASAGQLEVPDITHESPPDFEESGEKEPVQELAKTSEEEVLELLPHDALDQQRLETARNAMETGDLNVAIDEYTSLLDQGEGLPYLIAELETSIEQHGQDPLMQRLLGDVYVRNGQLKKAVEVYREALDNI